MEQERVKEKLSSRLKSGHVKLRSWGNIWREKVVIDTRSKKREQGGKAREKRLVLRILLAQMRNRILNALCACTNRYSTSDFS